MATVTRSEGTGSVDATKVYRGRQRLSTDDGMTGMSALTVVAFRDPYRAAEVLNDLRRRDWAWVPDLDDAVVVTWDERSRLKVQLSVDPTTKEAAPWVGVWGSFLNLALFVPITDGISEAVRDLAIATGAPHGPEKVTGMRSPDSSWWRANLRISNEFIRDIGALVQPGDSALFMLLRTPKAALALRHLRNYGGTILHAVLDEMQNEKLGIALAGFP